MAFINPSINNRASILSEEEKNDILDRLSKVEEEINNIKSVNEVNSIQEQKIEMPMAENLNEYQKLDLNIKEATLNGKPSILNIPIKEETKKVEVSDAEVKNTSEEYTLLNPNDYANKTYMTSANQRYSLVNESQRKIINDKNNEFNNSSEILSIDNIMKISWGAKWKRK